MDELNKNTLDGTELFDVEVSTVGFVKRGANGEPFFLLKSDDSTTKSDVVKETNGETDAEGTAQDQPQVEKSLWGRFKTLIQPIIEKKVDEAIAKAMPAGMSDKDEAKDENGENPNEEATETPDEEAKEEAAESEDDDKKLAKSAVGVTASAGEPTSLAGATEAVATSALGLPAQEVTKMAENEVVVVAKSDDKIALEKALDSIKQLNERVEKAEATAAQERESRERVVFLQKADEFSAVPVAKADLADNLYRLSKSDAKMYDFFTGVLKAMNAQVADMQDGLFVEKGTTQFTPETGSIADKVEQIKKSGKTDLEAIKSLTREEQATYLRDMQRKTK
jgi:hypothetical protein